MLLRIQRRISDDRHWNVAAQGHSWFFMWVGGLHTQYTPDVRLHCASLRPRYLLREFGSTILCTVYTPPSRNASRVAACIADTRSPTVCAGGLQQLCQLLALPTIIKCGIRESRVLDKCYRYVQEAYISKAKPPLTNSHHNIIHLIPTFKTVLKGANLRPRLWVFGLRTA